MKGGLCGGVFSYNRPILFDNWWQIVLLRIVGADQNMFIFLSCFSDFWREKLFSVQSTCTKCCGLYQFNRVVSSDEVLAEGDNVFVKVLYV